MDNPTTPGTAGVLPLVKGEMLGKSGLNVLGNKGVALGMDDSASIRDYLQQMINQRQAYKGSFEQGMDQMRSVLGGTQNEMAQNMQAQSNKERTNEQDVFNMRVNMAQLKTQEDRLMQEKMQAAQNQLNFTNALRAEQGLPPLPNPQVAAPVGAGPQTGAAPVGAGPQTGAAPVGTEPQTGAAPAATRPSNITPTQMVMLEQMYADPSTRAEAQKQFFALTKQDDIARRLKMAGVQEGSPAWNAAMFTNVVGANAFNLQDVRTPGGDVQQTPFSAANAVLGGNAPPAPQGALPSAAGAPPRPAAAPAPQGALPSAAAPVRPAVSAAPASATGINPATGFTYGSKQDLEELQKEAAVARAGRIKEQEGLANTAVKQQEQHSADVKEAQTNAMIAQNMQKDIRTAGSLLGKLAGGGAQSAFFGLIDGGIQVGNMGAVNLPKFTEAVVKMDPNAKKPEVMDAYTRVAKDVERMKLAYTRVAFENQGAVSNNERDLIKTAVGDVDRMSPANLMRMAKATELEARNKMDQDRLWSQMKEAGMTWSQYKSSPELKDMQRKQYYRTAKAFGVENAKYPGDQ